MDDLFARLAPAPLSVAQVNARARQLLERTFSVVAVVGEVSGHRVVSGHHYFCLKDREAQLSAVLFRREAASSQVELRDGMEVLATGRLTIYSQSGKYQLVLERIERRGDGALMAAFEELKGRLASEGLFAAERKRRLPLVPRRVAVVTSPTGAVIRDVINIALRRWPRASILVVPTRVQGAEAAPQVAAAVRRVSASASALSVDVVIVARGGGSLEDLWCFNDERVARAIFDAAVPVVSAVGHETDFTIADFVADLRAPTPSAAAELVFPLASELMATLAQSLARARSALRRDVSGHRLRLRALRAELGDAQYLVREQEQRLAALVQACGDGVGAALQQRRLRLHGLEARLGRLHPRVHLRDLKNRARSAEARVVWSTRQALEARRERLLALEQRLLALSPLGVLERGYAIVQREGGPVVRSAAEVAPGERIAIRLASGSLGATVTDRKEQT